MSRLDVQFGGLDLQFGAGGGGQQSAPGTGGPGDNSNNGGFEFNGGVSSVVSKEGDVGKPQQQQGVPAGGVVSAKDYLGAPPPQVTAAVATGQQQVKDKNNKLNSQSDSYPSAQGTYFSCQSYHIH